MLCRSTGVGEYELTLQYQTQTAAQKAGQIYLLPGAYTDAAAIDLAMNAGTLLDTVDFSTIADTVAAFKLIKEDTLHEEARKRNIQESEKRKRPIVF